MIKLNEEQENKFLLRVVEARLALVAILNITDDEEYRADLRQVLASIRDLQDKYLPLSF